MSIYQNISMSRKESLLLRKDLIVLKEIALNIEWLEKLLDEKETKNSKDSLLSTQLFKCSVLEKEAFLVFIHLFVGIAYLNMFANKSTMYNDHSE